MLVAQALSKSYGPTLAVAHVDLEVASGQIIGLVGNNGAGKSTAIKILTGILDPSSGHASLDGEDPRRAEVRRRIGYVPEESPLYDDLSPLQYLAYFGGLYGLSRKYVREQGPRLLRRLRLDEDYWRKPNGDLSKGSARKVALARALLHDPDVLILDEPRSGLDPGSQHVLDELLLEWRGAGKAILLSAHDLDQVERLCDEILVMDGGKIVVRGTLMDLQAKVGRTRYTISATHPFPDSSPEGTVHCRTVDDWPTVEGLLPEIRAGGGEVLDVRAQTPRLSDVLRAALGP